MKILLVSSYLPYPLFSGGHIRLYNLMKQLRQKYEITLVCEKRPHQTEDDVKEVKKICKDVIVVPRKKQWSIGNVLKTGFSLDPFLIAGHTNTEMKERVTAELTKNNYKLIHVETFYVMQNIPQTTLPIVLVEHNIEYLVYKRFADNAPFFLRPLLFADIYKLQRREKQAWNKATKLVAVSEDEKKLMKKPDAVVVSNGVDLERFTFKESEKKQYRSIAKRVSLPEKDLLFIGDFRWVQNRDTAQWIIQDIWPFLLRAVEGEVKIKLHIVGKNIPESLKKSNMYDSIVFDENAPKDTTAIFHKADVLLAPIRVGGGTSYKILEAMASGVPVVTTSLGKEGIEVKAGEEILVADTVQEIVEKTAHVLRDHDFHTKLAVSARKVIEDTYDWKVIGKKLDEVYKSLV